MSRTFPPEIAIEPLDLDQPFDVTVELPGSKSITNRSLVCAALADGHSTLRGTLVADDTEAMVDCLRGLGAGITFDRDERRIDVDGLGGVLPPGPIELDARLSGTTSRFLLPMLALGPGPYRLDGGLPLRRRPMGALIGALRQLGVTVDEEGEPGCLPVVVSGGPVAGGDISIDASTTSQFVSAILLNAPAFDGGLRVHLDGALVSAPYVELTKASMAAFGAAVERTDDDTTVAVPAARYRAADVAIEPDASAASYVLAAASLVPGGRVRVPHLGTASGQGDVGFVELLARMGVACVVGSDHVEVRGPDELRGIEEGVDLVDMPDMATTLAAVVVFADRPTTVRGVGIIREHETDRITATVTELGRCGIQVDEHDDGFTVHPGTPQPATIRTYDDHRIAMSFALLGLRVPGITIADPGVVAKTFPDFFETLDLLR